MPDHNVTIVPGVFVGQPQEVLTSTLERARVVADLLRRCYQDKQHDVFVDYDMLIAVAVLDDYLEAATVAASMGRK